MKRLSGWAGEHFGVTLQTIDSPFDLELEDVVGVALRRNPRRAHLLVSTVLGKHIPLSPELAAAAGRLLGELVAAALTGPTDRPPWEIDRGAWSFDVASAIRHNDPAALVGRLDAAAGARPEYPALVLGFAETATSLGHLVADQLNASAYLHSTRRWVKGAGVAATFEEGHSHAAEHLLLPVPEDLLDAADVLVLVDDELSTGTTAMQTITAAHARRPRERYVLAGLVDLRSGADQTRLTELAGRLNCRIEVVSLVRGTIALPSGLLSAVTAGLAANTPAEATAGRARRPRAFGAEGRCEPTHLQRIDLPWPAAVPDGGRHGFLLGDRADFSPAVDAAAQVIDDALPAAGSVIVVGHEELMYLPLQIARRLAASGRHDVVFQSTTRSPIYVRDEDGYPIRRGWSFIDLEGDDTPTPLPTDRFLYNAADPTNSQPPEPGSLVFVIDAAADSGALAAAGGALAEFETVCGTVLLAVLPAPGPAALADRRSAPGP